MLTRLLPDSDSPIIEVVGRISSLQDALDIVAFAYETGYNKVLLRSPQLPPEFFQLQTRFAGDFIQKLVNYRLCVAGVFEDGSTHTERFREYVGEARRGEQFRSFTGEIEAVAWLRQQ